MESVDDMLVPALLLARPGSAALRENGLRRVELYGLVLMCNIQFVQSFIRFLHNSTQLEKVMHP
ncbi:hypothetical protein [Pseudomonas fluorescens]|jgi:hypothetical protein|uniref:Uncharacterized protein n=1 Tax=Pseudomonas fluorescens TaxID=294 RepID=A0A5E7IH54_PSEFL|nr:hypothetical protein [Pseudomonas fluorescens]VVO75878.1 hypothetical protein PS880_01548 [Pseudomonas fluorescens]